MIMQCAQKTLEKVSLAVLDWKGLLSQDKPKLMSALQDGWVALQESVTSLAKRLIFSVNNIFYLRAE